MKENIVAKLTAKDDKYACALADKIVLRPFGKFQFFSLTRGLNTGNAGMLMCVACGNGSFEYRIEPSKTRRRRLC